MRKLRQYTPDDIGATVIGVAGLLFMLYAVLFGAPSTAIFGLGLVYLATELSKAIERDIGPTYTQQEDVSSPVSIPLEPSA